MRQKAWQYNNSCAVKGIRPACPYKITLKDPYKLALGYIWCMWACFTKPMFSLLVMGDGKHYRLMKEGGIALANIHSQWWLAPLWWSLMVWRPLTMLWCYTPKQISRVALSPEVISTSHLEVTVKYLQTKLANWGIFQTQIRCFSQLLWLYTSDHSQTFTVSYG